MLMAWVRDALWALQQADHDGARVTRGGKAKSCPWVQAQPPLELRRTSGQAVAAALVKDTVRSGLQRPSSPAICQTHNYALPV